MKTGIKFYNTDETFPPLDFARMVEDNGIESIWLERAAAVGKTMDVTLNLGRLDFLDRYIELGLDRVVYSLPSPLSDDETCNSCESWEQSLRRCNEVPRPR